MDGCGRSLTIRAFSIGLAGALALFAGRGEALSAEDAGSAARHFVIVKTYFKRSESERPARGGIYGYVEIESRKFEYEHYLRDRRPKREFGVLLPDGTVLVHDSVIDPSYFDRVEVEDAYGNVSPAERQAVLRDTPGMLIRVLEPEKLRAQPITFSAIGDVDFGDPGVKSVAVRDSTPDWTFEVGTTRASVRVGSDDSIVPSLRLELGPTSPALLFDQENRAVGIALTDVLPLRPESSPVWRGADLIKAEHIALESLHTVTGPAATIASHVYEVRVKYRQTVDEPDGISIFGVTIPLDFDPMSLNAEKLPIEQYFYGVPIGAGRFLVPFPIKRAFAKKIEDITVRIGESDSQARFLGSLRNLGAFVVAVDEASAPARAPFHARQVDKHDALVAIRTVHEFGERKQVLTHDRIAAYSRGKLDRPAAEMVGASLLGTVYGNLDGQIVGVTLEQCERDREIESLRGSIESFAEHNSIAVYMTADLAELVENPERNFDATIVPRAEEDEKRRTWIGVEYEPMEAELARTLLIEKATKGGTLGFVVSTVYAGSPAESLGLTSGDVLLRIVPGNGLDPIELAADEESPFPFDEFDLEMPPMMDGLGFDLPEKRPWKSRDNLLTRILEILGEGAEVELEYLRDGELRSAKTIVELAPPDFDSAEKHKDTASGLTVKSLTYEVRLALKIPEDEDPVVIAKVEEGSPAAVARVAQYDLVTRIDNEPVHGLESFRQRLGAAVPGEKRTLRLALQKLGRTRIADITIE